MLGPQKGACSLLPKIMSGKDASRKDHKKLVSELVLENGLTDLVVAGKRGHSRHNNLHKQKWKGMNIEIHMYRRC